MRVTVLRDTAETRMMESGASIVAVSRIPGRADVITTMRYAHPENSLKKAVVMLTSNGLQAESEHNEMK